MDVVIDFVVDFRVPFRWINKQAKSSQTLSAKFTVFRGILEPNPLSEISALTCRAVQPAAWDVLSL